MSQEDEKANTESSNKDEPQTSDQESNDEPDVARRGQSTGRATTRDEESDESGGLNQYESKRKAGESVRVATAKDAPADESTSEGESADGDDETSGPRRRVEVTDSDTDGEDEPSEETDSKSAESSDDSAPETSADSEGESDADDEPETEAASGSEPDTAHIDPDEMELDDEETGEPDLDVDMDDFVDDDEEMEDATTEDFAELYQQQDGDVPEQRDYETGERLEGTVLSITDEHIFVELDPQTNGIAKRRDFEDDEGELQLAEGDTQEFYIVDVWEDENEVYLGRELKGQQGSVDAIEDAYENGVPVEGKVVDTNKGGFEIEVHGVDAFCPISEIEMGFTEEKDLHIGANYRFKVSEFEEGGETIVLSRAALQREEREKQAEETLDNLEAGNVVEGVVTRTTGFGAFVDLGGVEGLVHVSELSHRQFDHPDDVVESGESVEVEVEEIEMPDDDEDDPRISLSRKATETNPWEEVNERYAEDMETQGSVENIEDFGVFVKLPSGITALLPRSEMNLESGSTPHSRFDVEDTVTARVLDIDPEEREMALTMREEDERGGADESQTDDSETPSEASVSTGNDEGSGFGTLGDMIGDQLQDRDE